MTVLCCDTVVANERYNKKMREKDGKMKWKIVRGQRNKEITKESNVRKKRQVV